MRHSKLTSSTVFKHKSPRSIEDNVLQSSPKLSRKKVSHEIQENNFRRSAFEIGEVIHSQKMKTKSNFNKKDTLEELNNLPNKISIGFHIKKKKNIKQQKRQGPDRFQISSMISNSMRKYLEKVDRSRQAKLSKNTIVSEFGLDIKKIHYEESKRIMEKVIKIRQQLSTQYNQSSLEIPKIKTQNKSLHRTIRLTTPPAKNSLNFSKKSKEQPKEVLVDRMRQFMDFYKILLYSYGCYSKQIVLSPNPSRLTISKKQRKEKYNFYVGQGNNKYLIIQILKKRWWWTQTQDINNADFVWTQLRNNEISLKHTTIQHQIPTPEIKEQKCTLNTETNHYSKLFHSKANDIFLNPMNQEQQKKYLRLIVRPNVLHNHYPSNFILGNKQALFKQLEGYSIHKKINLFDIIPLTFHVQNSNCANWDLFEIYAKNSRNLWIIKPGQNSNRGQGIWVSDNIEQIKEKIKLKNDKHTYIIQKYIKNIFLFNQRKFDIRTYLLKVTIGGCFKFYWYKEGYIRTSSEVFDVKELKNTFIHLTNDAIQSQGQNYGKFQPGNKISYRQFQRYLNHNLTKKYSMQDLISKMKQIAKKVTLSTYTKIDPRHQQFGIQLFGMDFLIDSSFRPWLLEVNTNPCLQLTSPCLQRLIPRMLENMMRIGLDPIFQPCCQCPRSLMCNIPCDIAQNNDFELIFDSQFDRDLQWEEISNKQPQVCYNEENQTYEEDGQQQLHSKQFVDF